MKFQLSSTQIHQWRKATFRFNEGEGPEEEQGEEQPHVLFFRSAVSPPTSPTPFPAGIASLSLSPSSSSYVYSCFRLYFYNWCFFRYCDFKSSVFNEPLFQFGRKYFRSIFIPSQCRIKSWY